MRVVLESPVLGGAVDAIPSKSEVHRALILLALSQKGGTLLCRSRSEDMDATASSLSALGAEIVYGDGQISVTPVDREACRQRREIPVLPVGESGSTLRFLLPVAAALCPGGVIFEMKGRLPERPLSPLKELLEEKGIGFRYLSKSRLLVSGCLPSGDYTIRGDVSSQFVSGLLLALPLLTGDSRLTVTGKTESAPYIAMTLDALRHFTSAVCDEAGYFTEKKWLSAPSSLVSFRIKGREQGVPVYALFGGEKTPFVGGDYSNAAFFLTAAALGKAPLTVNGLLTPTAQGDRAILSCLSALGAHVEENGEGITVYPSPLVGREIDASQIPDLVPILAVAAAGAVGETRFVHAERLRLKESDRLKTTAEMLRAVGAAVKETADGLLVMGGNALSGGGIDAAGDHRIAMAAAVLATICTGRLEIRGAEAVRKSYPAFFADFKTLMTDGSMTVTE